MRTTFDLQPLHLANGVVTLIPLTEKDFEDLYSIAADPLIWEQHPTRNRYKREVFEVFFAGAIKSKGAFKILDTQTSVMIGSSRYYDYHPEKKSVMIGYTFLARQCWGKSHNKALKSLMIGYAFNFVDEVLFQIGENNIRSQKAIEKLGAKKAGQEEVAYAGEQHSSVNYIYKIDKATWQGIKF